MVRKTYIPGRIIYKLNFSSESVVAGIYKVVGSAINSDDARNWL